MSRASGSHREAMASSRRSILPILQLAIFLVSACEAFQTTLPGPHVSLLRNRPANRLSTACSVLATPPPGKQQAASSDPPKKLYYPKAKRKRSPPKRDDVWSSGRWHRAVQVESKLLSALESLQQAITSKNFYPLPFFPSVRDCNAALAAFGDGEDLLRALRLFVKMRKTAALTKLYPPGVIQRAPIPTLVTYSTIMSRAMYLGKPLVALRLWNVMRQQQEFFSTPIGIKVPTALRIIPDVKAANILMNVYAKLGDVTLALDLLDQMHHGTGKDVPKMRPNIVTYNTLLDACHIGGELDIALRIKDELEHAGLRPDARTYTTLIATVARKATAISGANDPTLAFSILEEMQQRLVRPNGMTFSALIDVCGRCRRSDLALKGLRIMLDQKTSEQGCLESNNNNNDKIESPQKYTLYNEVGAWTAAINACGKAGRIESAVKLFYAMPNFGVFPNTITCGCLTDCLLRNGRTADTLNVLRYMKKHRIAPSEVMYTSLITSAGRLAQFENEQQNIRILAAPVEEDQFPVDESGATKAIEMYTELIMSLAEKQGAKSRTNKYTGVRDKTNGKEDSNELMKIFLVFQEMKTVGAHPDLACYNALLKTCAIAGDVERAQEVLRQIQDDGEIDPNDTTWRHMMIAAGKSARSDVAISTWKSALEHRSQHDDDSSTRKWTPSVDSLGSFVAALIHSASDLDEQDKHTRVGLYRLVVTMYKDIWSESKNSLGVHRVNREKVLQNPWIMLMFIQAAVSLEKELKAEKNMPQSGYTKELRGLAASIVASPCFRNGVPHSLRQNKSLLDSFRVGETWLKLP